MQDATQQYIIRHIALLHDGRHCKNAMNGARMYCNDITQDATQQYIIRHIALMQDRRHCMDVMQAARMQCNDIMQDVMQQCIALTCTKKTLQILHLDFTFVSVKHLCCCKVFPRRDMLYTKVTIRMIDISNLHSGQNYDTLFTNMLRNNCKQIYTTR